MTRLRAHARGCRGSDRLALAGSRRSGRGLCSALACRLLWATRYIQH